MHVGEGSEGSEGRKRKTSKKDLLERSSQIDGGCLQPLEEKDVVGGGREERKEKKSPLSSPLPLPLICTSQI